MPLNTHKDASQNLAQEYEKREEGIEGETISGTLKASDKRCSREEGHGGRCSRGPKRRSQQNRSDNDRCAI